MFDGNWRQGVDKAITPVGAWIHKRLRINANHLTFLGLLFAIGCMYFLARGHFLPVGIILFLLTGVADLLDGSIAKAAKTVSIKGSFFDSFVDRISDACILMGLSWYILSTHQESQFFTFNSESQFIVFLPVAISVLIQLISYQRAKAESLGLNAKSGLMERAERFIVLGFGIIFNMWLLETLLVFLVLVIITAIQRFVKIMLQSRPAPK